MKDVARFVKWTIVSALGIGIFLVAFLGGVYLIIQLFGEYAFGVAILSTVILVSSLLFAWTRVYGR